VNGDGGVRDDNGDGEELAYFWRLSGTRRRRHSYAD